MSIDNQKTSLYLNKNLEVYKLKGNDREDLLQRISTNSIVNRERYDHRTTLLLNDKGKLVDMLQLGAFGEYDLVISKSYETAFQYIDKYTFTEDISFEKTEFVLFEVLLAEGETTLLDTQLSPAKVNVLELNGTELYAFVEYSNHVRLAVPKALVSELEDLEELEFISEAAFEQWRINSFVGELGKEYTDQFIPLEIGLIDYISFTKGCYIGQEIIARLDTYKKVTKYLAQLKTECYLEPDMDYVLKNDSGKKLGVLTSLSTLNQDGYFHLCVLTEVLPKKEPQLILKVKTDLLKLKELWTIF